MYAVSLLSETYRRIKLLVRIIFGRWAISALLLRQYYYSTGKARMGYLTY